VRGNWWLKVTATRVTTSFFIFPGFRALKHIITAKRFFEQYSATTSHSNRIIYDLAVGGDQESSPEARLRGHLNMAAE
jgi:hypothetical protein